jgi:hypothetical protein
MGVAVVVLALGSVAAADDGGRPLSTALTGAAEVPGPGDPDATGQADLMLNQGKREVCFKISWADIDGEVFAGHIHSRIAYRGGARGRDAVHRVVPRH